MEAFFLNVFAVLAGVFSGGIGFIIVGLAILLLFVPYLGVMGRGQNRGDQTKRGGTIDHAIDNGRML